MMTRAGAAMVNGRVFAMVTPAESVARRMTFDEPAADGVPVIFDPLTPSPAGSPVVADHVYGGVPPVALSAWEYATPTVPFASEDVPMTSAGATVSVRALLAVAFVLSLTVIFTLETPVAAAVGVPLIFCPFTLMPAGRPVADHVYGGSPPEAASACE